MPKSKTTTKKVKKEKKEKIIKKSASSADARTRRKKEKPEEIKKPIRYSEAIGRRKTAIARVRFFTRGEKMFLINEKPLEKYFPSFELQQIVKSPLQKMNCLDRFGVLVKVRGGGGHAQAEAVRHGIARALIIFSPDFRKRLKKAGFLTRDSRMRERKKFGLKRARKAPQWQKR